MPSALRVSQILRRLAIATATFSFSSILVMFKNPPSVAVFAEKNTDPDEAVNDRYPRQTEQ